MRSLPTFQRDFSVYTPSRLGRLGRLALTRACAQDFARFQRLTHTQIAVQQPHGHPTCVRQVWRNSFDMWQPCIELLMDLRKEHNMSILFITHALGQAYYVSDRVLVMYHGQLVEQGPVELVLSAPQHDYTKRLMSDVPLLHGRRDMLGSQ